MNDETTELMTELLVEECRRLRGEKVSLRKQLDEANDEIEELKERIYYLEKPKEIDWISWYGGKCPVDPESHVWLKFRNGVEGLSSLEAGRYTWGHGPNQWGADIIAYKPA